MRNFRAQLSSRGVRGLAVALATFFLASSIVVATPQTAQAFTFPPPPGAAAPVINAIVASASSDIAVTGTTAASGGLVSACVASVACPVALIAGAALIFGAGYLTYQVLEPNFDLINPPEGGYAFPGWSWVNTPTIASAPAGSLIPYSYSFHVDPAQRPASGSFYVYYFWTKDATNTPGTFATTKSVATLDSNGNYTHSGSFSASGASYNLIGVLVNDPTNDTQNLTGCTSLWLSACVWRNGDLAYGVIPQLTNTGTTQPNPQSTYPANPLRKMQARAQCVSATGTASFAYAYTSTYRHTDSVLPKIPLPGCPDGTSMTELVVYEWIQNISGRWVVETVPTLSWSIPQTTIQDYPECLTGGTVCETEVIDHPDGNTYCTWGPYVFQNAECLEVPLTNPDGTTYTIPHTVPSDPAEPTPSPSPTPTPTPTPTTSPEPSPSPTPTPTPTPTPVDPNTNDPAAIPDPINPSDGSGCAPSGWSLLNPFSYVRSTVCILEWAFIPPDIATPMTQVQAALDISVIGVVGTATTDFLGPFSSFQNTGPGYTNCLGPLITLPIAFPGTDDLAFHPFAACEPPASTMSQFVLILSTITIAIGGIWIVLSIVMSAFGLHLSLFNSGGGSDE